MTSDSSEQSSGFWTLTRPSKLSKRRNSDLHELHHKVFNICVVGLSGADKDKGPIGIGKSCFCNRFVRSAADDYQPEHISVLSQSDFNGRVVNNDHWLYWGSVIKSCEGCDLAFNIVEQTEFVDDSCFQPFKSDKIEPYFKRCANTKLMSHEKLMYIGKNQLGVEREYEQRYLPDGKFNVDGFLCLFDVSEVQGRNIDKLIEITNLILLNLIKTKKPVVFVTTKHDEANEVLIAEAERLINQRDFRGVIPIVETSAQENVNVNMAFLVCAQLIDKTRAKFRVPPYFEAVKNQLDLLNAASEAYLRLIRSTVIDYRTSWQQVCIKLSHNPEFLQYTYVHGLDKATYLFKNHLKTLRDDCINQKVQIYLKTFPEVLNELIPIGTSISNGSTDISLGALMHVSKDWETVKEQLRSHPSFDKYFIDVPKNMSWFDTELLHSPETRIPIDWLDSEEAFSIFQRRNMIVENAQRRFAARESFLDLLSSIKVTVGQPFIELKHLFTAELEVLNDQELFEIYVEFQNNLLQEARTEFQELLLENAEHLHPLTSSEKVIRQEDIQTINNILQHDERYQALDRFNQDRTLMIIRHLSFLHSQTSEQCPSYPNCVESEVERLLISKAKAAVNKYHESKSDSKPNTSSPVSRTCDLIIFGPRRPSQQLILALNVLNSRAPKSSQYQITFTVFDNTDEVDNQIQRFRQSDGKPRGCFGIFTNIRSLEHVNYTLERFLMLSSQSQKDKSNSRASPIVILYAADITLDERAMLALENDGQQLAGKFKCPFMNVTAIDQYRQHQQNNILTNDQDSTSQVMSECASLDYACVDAAFNVLKEAISRELCFIELFKNQDLIPRQALNPDAKILMCLLCGEPFSLESFLGNIFFNQEDCYVTSSKSVCLKIKADKGQDKYIEIIITSYTHGAYSYREDLLHGFILVCSTQRRASISILNAFSYNIPCTPVLILAIKNDGASKSKSHLDDVADEAHSAANRLKGHIEVMKVHTQSSARDQKRIKPSKTLANFLQTVIKRKPSIDRAYELDDNDITLPMPSSYDDELAQPKKLDLSQFDNITNAIGKLNIHSKVADMSPVVQSRPGQPQAQTSANSPQHESSFFKGRAKKTKNRAKELRQNHGRAVAPPQLPGSASTSGVNYESDHNKNFPALVKITHIEGDEAAMDFNQSPIAQRLLKHSKNHKVSELSSPYESDNEPSQPKNSQRNPKPARVQSSIPDENQTGHMFTKSSIDSSDLMNSREVAIRQLNKILANKQNPGFPPKRLPGRSMSFDHDENLPNATEKSDKESKKDRKKIRDDEKLEKKRLKEEEKQRREEKRQEKKLASKKSKSNITAEMVGDDGVPYFIRRCVEFIEAEGLDAEGIYRVPGNRAHVDAFVQKFKDNPQMSIVESDIPVNAVATALKDFLSKKWGPIIPNDLMDELTELSNIPESQRVQALRNLVNRLPSSNYKLLKYVFSHFVK